ILNMSIIPFKSAQSTPPMNELVFTVGAFPENDGDLPQEYIGIVDTATLEVRTFYQDAQAISIRPLSWSPDGKLLAILRIHDELAVDNAGDAMLNSARTSICILDETGVLQTCLESPPSSYWYTAPA